MLTNKQIMKEARTALRGNWGKAAAFTAGMSIFLIALALIFDVNHFITLPTEEEITVNGFTYYGFKVFLAFFGLAIAFAVINWTVSYAVYIGSCSVYLDFVKTGKFNWKLVKNGFKKIWRNTLSCFVANALMGIAIAVIIGITVGAATFFGIFASIASENKEASNLVIMVVLCVVWTAAITAILYKWLPTATLLLYKLASDNDIKAIAAIKKTFHEVSPNNWKFWCLSFRFTGWFLLCIVTLGIALLWIAPYIAATVAIFYREISGANDIPEDVEILKEGQTENLQVPEDPRGQETSL